jgi:hypothetical protein
VLSKVKLSLPVVAVVHRLLRVQHPVMAQVEAVVVALEIFLRTCDINCSEVIIFELF